MTTLLEMAALADDAVLLKRFIVATDRAAAAVLAESPPVADRVAWAKRALTPIETPRSRQYAAIVLRLAAVSNSDFQLAGVDVTDAEIETIVAAHIPKFVAGGL